MVARIHVDAAKERVEARQLAERAMQLDQDDSLVLAHAGQVYSYMLEDPETGADFAARAVALDPNLVLARLCAGWAQLYFGNVDAAIEQFSAAVCLSPIDPHFFLPQTGMAMARFFAGRYEEGLSWATRAQLSPAQLSRRTASNNGEPGDGWAPRRGPSCLSRSLAKRSHFAHFDIQSRTPFRRREDIEKLGQTYRTAGVPEWPVLADFVAKVG